MAVAWHLEQKLICSGCGHFIDETMDHDSTWVAEAITCEACAARERDEEEWSESDAKPYGVRYLVHKGEVIHAR